MITALAVYALLQLFGSNERTPQPELIVNREFTPVVYLSPSNQINNRYAYGDTTESAVMRKIGESAGKYLGQNGITVVIAEAGFSLEERINYSNENSVTAHVAIHSGDEGKGTLCCYNPHTDGSEILAKYIYDRVSRLTTSEDRGLLNGTTGETYSFEVSSVNAADCLIEIDNHDTIEGAKWLEEHTDELGRSIADGILQYIEYARTVWENNTEDGGETNGEQDKLSEGT